MADGIAVRHDTRVYVRIHEYSYPVIRSNLTW